MDGRPFSAPAQHQRRIIIITISLKNTPYHKLFEEAVRKLIPILHHGTSLYWFVVHFLDQREAFSTESLAAEDGNVDNNVQMKNRIFSERLLILIHANLKFDVKGKRHHLQNLPAHTKECFKIRKKFYSMSNRCSNILFVLYCLNDCF